MKRVLVTGGAGFVGGNLCVGLAERNPDWTLVALDNLRRRGSELNLPRLARAGVAFVHGDVRAPEDLSGLGPLDVVIECSAEPSVMAGVDGPPDDVIRTNLFGVAIAGSRNAFRARARAVVARRFTLRHRRGVPSEWCANALRRLEALG